MVENLALTFFGFMILNCVLLLSASFLSLALLKYQVKNWAKFILAVFIFFTLQVFSFQIFLGIFAQLNYKNVWLVAVAFLLTCTIFVRKKILQTIFPPLPKIRFSPFLLIFIPFIGLFLVRYFYALFQVPLEYDSIAYHLPFGNDLLVNFINFSLFGLLILSLYLVFRNFKVHPSVAWLSIAFLLYMPISPHFFGFPHVEIFFVTCFSIAVYFLQEFWKTKSLSDLFLLSLSLGFFIGTKYLGLPYALPLLFATLIIIIKSFIKERKTIFKAMGILSGSSILAGGFWYIRNWLESGNPLFPTDVALAGLTLFEGYYGMTERIFKLSLAYNIKDLTGFQEFIAGFQQKVGLQTYLIPLIAVGIIIFLIFILVKIIIQLQHQKNTSALWKDASLALTLLLGTFFYFYFYWKAPYSFNNLVPNVRYAIIFMFLTTLMAGFLFDRIKISRPFLYIALPLIIFYNISTFVLHDNNKNHIDGDKILFDIVFILNHLSYFIVFIFWLVLAILFFYSVMYVHKWRKLKYFNIFLVFFLIFLAGTTYLFHESSIKRDLEKLLFRALLYC